MPEYKLVLGYLSIVLAVIGYGIYFWQVFSDQIKPHAFSWLVWALTTGIIFFGQIVKGAGAGAWATGAISLACLIIFILAIFKGQRTFVVFDWIFLTAALSSLLLWKLTKDPTLALILLIITDAFATFPTLRKAYYKPFDDSATLFSINVLRSFISILAFKTYSLVAVLYPIKLVIFNALLVAVLLLRRKQKVVES